MKIHLLRSGVAAIALTFALLFCSSCSIPDEVKDAIGIGDERYVAVAKEASEDGDELEFEAAEEYEDYESEYTHLRADVYFELLSEKEQLIYRVFEYALEEGCPYVYFDERLLEDLDYAPEEILYLFSLDSPLLEQNLSYSLSSFRTGGDEMRLVEICVDAFSEKKLKKKKEALKEAQALVEDFIEEDSERETAENIYWFLTENVSYRDYDDEENDANYLYDALIRKETHCDGFTNSYSLLCRLAGLDCFEKADQVSDGETGHTWNTVCLDGEWYNVDCALSDDAAEEQSEYGVAIRFGFSDERQSGEVEYEKELPSCDEDLLPLDLEVSATDSNLAKKVAREFEKVDRDYLLIRMKKGELSRDKMQDMADEMGASFTAVQYEWGGSLYYMIVKK